MSQVLTDVGALRGARILLGVTGGIAAYKAVEICRLLQKAGAEVRVIMTKAATRFVGQATFAAITHHPAPADVFDDADQTLHVRLARWADLMIVAPATANTIAKAANGIADDLVSSTLLMRAGRLLVAPAMHTEMWQHPATQANIATLRERGAAFVGPEEGELSIGDEGIGRLAEPPDVVAAAAALLASRGDMTGLRVLVTAGGTQEPIDPIRFIGNRSSGKMGFAIANEAARRGAQVTLVTGPSALADPDRVTVVRVRTSQEMRNEVVARFDDCDVVVKAAAVADFRPAKPSDHKLKKDEGAPDIALERTPDILAELGLTKTHQILVGFAAETQDAVAYARKKLAAKNLDMVVANVVTEPGAGFEHDTNRAMLIAADGSEEDLPLQSKAAMAAVICDRIAVRLRS
ncbi:MAG TPA: bifunctional phosphopantothenoylcysteine decarboxylase/phosphopantothenate--cysteine ligase CoaBC [Actinomycetota bacterium]|nr:bifunctional phosphopantothenoylcysteine decarboxylase/phosphopantothenate--cysteine ligase CoaBC [Actinomycetota bacterium]